MSTLRITNIEAKADPSSPTVDEKIKLTNSNGDILVHIDGKTAGVTTIGINTTDRSFTVDAAQNVEFLGIVTATKFSLSGGGEITGGDGFDFALECIGRPLTMRASYDAVRRGGTACIVGVGRAEEMVEFSAFELFFMEKTLVGSYYGGTDVRSDFHKLLRLYKQGQLDLEGMITRRIKIDEINPALEAVRKGEVIRQVIEF